MDKEKTEWLHHEINKARNFWLCMFGEDVWLEVSKDAPKNGLKEKFDFLYSGIFSEIGKRLTGINIFKDVEDTEPNLIPLEWWIYETMNPIYSKDKNKKEAGDLVEDYRRTFDKSIKKKLPCCTISATFNGVRNLKSIDKKNPFIVIDIDRFTKSKIRRSNNCIDMQLAKEMLMQHPSTVYVGYSCSGDGIYAILKIYDAERLDEYFEFFRDRFSRIGINIDESCKDYTRLRFFSIDTEGYFNPDAKAYRIPEKKKPKNEGTKTALDNTTKIEKICSLIEQTGKDITGSYADWIVIGAGLYDEFGDMGVNYFHRISKNHPDYNFKECEKKFNQCKKLNRSKINVVFGVASAYGIRY